jgi:hypothetical protein
MKRVRYARERCLTHHTNFSTVTGERLMQPNTNTTPQPSITRFASGQTYVTPGAEEALMIAGQTGIEFLRRHMSLDNGELSDEDVRKNELSLREGFRVLSAYRTAKGQKLWIITEADRSSTTILLPHEY